MLGSPDGSQTFNMSGGKSGHPLILSAAGVYKQVLDFATPAVGKIGNSSG
jgi:hypothetical protein